MNVAVCLKHVPDPATVEVDPVTAGIDEGRLLYVTNPADESALERALDLRGDGEAVFALTVGPPAAEVALGDSLAAVRGPRAAPVGRDVGWTEPPLTAALLAAALRAEGAPDLVWCGVRGSGQVPALLAERLRKARR